MSGFTQINLARLPAPKVIETVAFEELLAEMKLAAIAELPELADVLELESEPATKLLRVCAYYRMLDRLAFNDGAKACMLALATGRDLDGLAAFWGVARLVLQEAAAGQTPPVPEILETDADFRRRVQLSLEGHSTAGPIGAYVFWALSSAADVKDAGVESPAPGEVLVTVLSRTGDGTASPALVAAVAAQLNDDEVRPLTDLVTVQGAAITTYEVQATLTLYPGPDESTVLAAVEAAVETYVEDHHHLGHDIVRSGLYAALHQPGVQAVTLTEPAADLVLGPSEAAWCSSISIAVGGRDV